jgi:hypothetical protein
VCGPPAEVGRKSRNLNGGTRTVVSYANCGLPYYIGGVIEKESSLLVASEKMFREQFAIDCRTRVEVMAISPEKKTVALMHHATSEVTTERYDKLVPIARSVVDPSATARHRPTRSLPGQDRA